MYRKPWAAQLTVGNASLAAMTRQRWAAVFGAKDDGRRQRLATFVQTRIMTLEQLEQFCDDLQRQRRGPE